MGHGHLKPPVHDLREKDNVEGIAVADCWKTRARRRGQARRGAAGLCRLSQGARHQGNRLRHRRCARALACQDHDRRALDAGKAVYCEKPLTHTIPEGQAVAKKQKETKLPVQVGVQATSDDCYQRAAEAIKGGVLGQVVQAQIEYVRRYDYQGAFRERDIKADQPQPPDLDWKTWLGDAPTMPWSPHHYYEWRAYSAYSGGIATDLFIHRITRILKACDLMYPRRVVGMGGIWQWPDGRDTPDNFEMIYANTCAA